MHNRHGQSGFHFWILDLKACKQEHSFIFSVTKVRTIKAQAKDQAKKESVSVPYCTTVLWTLLKYLQCVLRLYCHVLLILKISPIIAGKRLWICLYGKI